MKELPSQTFLVIRSNPDDWVLPEEYSRVCEQHLGSLPTELKLPWPTHISPKNVGDEVSFSNMLSPYADFVVEKFEYFYSRKNGISQYIVLKQEEPGTDFRLDTLLYAADEGFLFESDISIAQALRDAGLQYTIAK